MGQRYLELQTSFTSFTNNNTAILHVSQLPPNAALFAPGPALLFIVVDGVPSVGVQVMVGSGNIEAQPMLPPTELPPSRVTAEEIPEDEVQGGAEGRRPLIALLMTVLFSGILVVF